MVGLEIRNMRAGNGVGAEWKTKKDRMTAMGQIAGRC
jgi:hypothetical protein